ncbi:MAG TPA: hypothetical protein VNT02_00315 [Burkholderiales bacterium]|nr:hypothetical protein [Burkholderiales bacterium]
MNRHLSPAQRSRRIAAVVGAAVALTTLGGCDWIKERFAKAPNVRFAPYQQAYNSKPDFAQLEHKLPLTAEERNSITPANLGALEQEQLDQIYARLTAGPIPDGAYDGQIQLPRGASGRFRVAEIAGGYAEYALHLKGLKIEDVGESLWKGKVFYRNERVLRNRIEDFSALKKAGLVEGEPRKTNLNGKETWLLFPAKLYCGQSLLDARRESIIIDYFFSDDIPGYQENPDYLAGRRGIRVRDEIRMIRPGFYLGRAYVDRIFLLNFTLYNKAVADSVDAGAGKAGAHGEDCWTGRDSSVARVSQR